MDRGVLHHRQGTWGVGAQLWESWQKWCTTNSERPGSRKGFTEAMAAHGYPKDKSQGVRGYSEITLRPGERTRADLD